MKTKVDLDKKCLTCGMPIPDRAHQNPNTVRACSAPCAVALFWREEHARQRIGV